MKSWVQRSSQITKGEFFEVPDNLLQLLAYHRKTIGPGLTGPMVHIA